MSFVYFFGYRISQRPRTSSSKKGSMLDRIDIKAFNDQPTEIVFAIDTDLKCTVWIFLKLNSVSEVKGKSLCI